MNKKLAITAIILVSLVSAVYFFYAGSKPSNTNAMNSEITPEQAKNTGTEKKAYTLQDVAQHKTAESCWTVVSNKVYDLTKFTKQHPGGEQGILSMCGIDGTSAYNDQHGGQRDPKFKLDSLYIGDLQK